MNEFDRQFAIRLPDSSLFSWPAPESNPYLPRFLTGPKVEVSTRPFIFDNEDEAQQALDRIQVEAAKIGITNIGAAVVSRVVGPWGDVNLAGFMAAVEGHANGDPS